MSADSTPSVAMNSGEAPFVTVSTPPSVGNPKVSTPRGSRLLYFTPMPSSQRAISAQRSSPSFSLECPISSDTTIPFAGSLDIRSQQPYFISTATVGTAPTKRASTNETTELQLSPIERFAAPPYAPPAPLRPGGPPVCSPKLPSLPGDLGLHTPSLVVLDATVLRHPDSVDILEAEELRLPPLARVGPLCPREETPSTATHSYDISSAAPPGSFWPIAPTSGIKLPVVKGSSILPPPRRHTVDWFDYLCFRPSSPDDQGAEGSMISPISLQNPLLSDSTPVTRLDPTDQLLVHPTTESGLASWRFEDKSYFSTTQFRDAPHSTEPAPRGASSLRLATVGRRRSSMATFPTGRTPSDTEISLELADDVSGSVNHAGASQHLPHSEGVDWHRRASWGFRGERMAASPSSATASVVNHLSRSREARGSSYSADRRPSTQEAALKSDPTFAASTEADETLRVDVHTGWSDLSVVLSSSRPRWRTRLDYILSCFGFAVGLPTVWRFPYICYQNGGGSFLIAYLILAFAIGLPMYQLELSLGQLLQTGFVRIWPTLSPKLGGLGFSSAIVATICMVYFSVIQAWSIYYFAKSFLLPHPWSYGGNSMPDSANHFFLDGVLHRSSSISDFDFANANPWLWVCLLTAWVAVYLSSNGRATRSGLLSAFAALFPIVGCLILLSRGLTLPGASLGLRAFLTPSFTALMSPALWGKALLQVFFSCGIGWGTLVNFASFSDRHNDFLRDAWIVLGFNVSSSIIAGLAVFALLGHMASHMELDTIANVVQPGSGLIFVVFPSVLESVPVFMGFLTWIFFIVIIALGFSSILTLFTLLRTIMDDCELLRGLRWSHRKFTAIICVALFLCAVPLCLPNGVYIIDLLDGSAGTVSLLVIALAEVLVVTRILRYEQFANSVRHLTGVRLRLFFRLLLKYVFPGLLLAVMIGAFEDLSSVTQSRKAPSRAKRANPSGCGEDDCGNASHRGSCESRFQFCRCNQGWQGVFCGDPTPKEDQIGCPEMCNEQGLCDLTTGQCHCNTEFFGESCRYDRFSEHMPAWTNLITWAAAVGSLVPAILVLASPRWQTYLAMMMTRDKPREDEVEQTAEWDIDPENEADTTAHRITHGVNSRNASTNFPRLDGRALDI